MKPKHSVCPECKNDINLDRYPNLAIGNVIECDVCGITLVVRGIDNDSEVYTEIADEGK